MKGASFAVLLAILASLFVVPGGSAHAATFRNLVAQVRAMVRARTTAARVAAVTRFSRTGSGFSPQERRTS